MQGEATVRNSRESTLRKEIDRLKRLLVNKTVEVDFFSCALQKVRLDAGTAVSLAGRRVYRAIRDVVARQLECRANVPARASAPGGILPIFSDLSAVRGEHDGRLCHSPARLE